MTRRPAGGHRGIGSKKMVGINLYGFVDNDGVNQLDTLGLRDKDQRLGECQIEVPPVMGSSATNKAMNASPTRIISKR